MSEDSRKESSRKITDSELLTILKEADSPVLKTTEIAERDDVPIGARQVENRLKSLESQDQVGSRIVTANPEAKLWWDKRLEMKQGWPSKNEVTDEIGVEAVDILDLPGRGETLRKRREATNAVFKYLFAEEEAVASELRLVGWGVDMDTYGSSESLWNNCLNPALNESYFFQLHETEKEWQLSWLGLWLRNRDERGLWNNWGVHKQDINRSYHQWLQDAITLGNNVENIDPLNSRVAYQREDCLTNLDYSFVTVLTMDGEVWVCDEGSLFFSTVVWGDKDWLRDIYNKKERKSSNLNFDVEWKDHIESQSQISVHRFRDIELDVSDLLKDLNPDGSGQRLKQINKWVDETRDGMVEIFSTES